MKGTPFATLLVALCCLGLGCAEKETDQLRARLQDIPVGSTPAAAPLFPFDAVVRPPMLSGCHACQYLVHALQEWGAQQPQLSCEGVATHTQIVCEQNSFSDLLKVPCPRHAVVLDWLVGGGLLPTPATAKSAGKAEIIASIKQQGPTFCESPTVALCGPSGHGNEIAQKPSVAVRFKLDIDLSTMQRGSRVWRDFVHQLLGEISLAIDCPPNRLEYHDHPYDDQVEFVIRGAGLPSLPPWTHLKTPLQTMDATKAIEPSPASALELALRFKDLVESGKSVVRDPNHILSHTNVGFRVQAFTLK